MAERQKLVKLRNELFSSDFGNILFEYLHDKVTEYATKNLDAIEIKGMCRLIQDLKDIPGIVEQMK